MPFEKISAFLALAVGLTGCRTPAGDADGALRRAGIRTVMLEGRFTLYAPYDAERTARLAEVVGENLRAVCGTLGVEFDRPVQVHARSVDDPGFGVELEETDVLTGFTPKLDEGDPPTVVFFVAGDEDAEPLDVERLLQAFHINYAGRIRHELGHLCAEVHLPDGPTWFHEGLALEMEYSRPAGDRLVPKERPQTISLASRLQDGSELSRILAWREDGSAIARGEEEPFEAGRPLAHAYMRFLLERGGGSRSIESFRAILEMRPDEHLALEQEWRAWLGGGGSDL